MEGVVVKELKPNSDERGWLAEVFRADEISAHLRPEMAYVSLTSPGAQRGPHEHRRQTDYFCFMGAFKVYMWDNRRGSKTFGEKSMVFSEEGTPKLVIVPPGVVHAYKNVGEGPGFVLNLPNRLYRGYGRIEEADEIRYEGSPESGFIID
jgi:dTDP-4-dehydrorhamnose 3,5-epimerase